ncbi:MAG: cadherin-like domain-containing protein, partial [Planctomycetales bacterium]|nr:cadherin-like domain-containing protein [Planctomycetales bacterium]
MARRSKNNLFYQSFQSRQKFRSELLCTRPSRRRRLVTESLEARQLLAGDLYGTLYSDTNANGARDQGEPGLYGWAVFLDDNSNGILDSGEASTLTNSDGDYRFSRLDAGNYRIAEVVRDGWTPTNPTSGYQDVTVVDGQELRVNFLNNGVIGTGVITGNVYRDNPEIGVLDALDTPVAGWQVFIDLNGDTILDPDEPFAYTDGDGNYVFTGVVGGAPGNAISYEVQQVLTPGWDASPGFDENYTAEVVEGETFVGPDFLNEPVDLSSVTGTVWEDANENGVQDAGESGLSGWVVYVDLNLDNSFDVTTEPYDLTSSNGGYQIYGVDPGQQRVAVVGQIDHHATSPASGYQTIYAPNQGSVDNVDFGFKERTDAAIGGVIFADRDRDGSRDVGEEGLAGITVFLDLNNNGSLDAGEPNTQTRADLFYTPDTDEAGSYRFEKLGKGTYVVRQIVPTLLSSTPASESVQTVTLGPADDLSSVDCADQYRPSEIHGVKYEDRNGNHVRELDEPGLEGVTIFVDLNRNNLLDPSEPFTQTLADGSYSFTELEAGAYVVREIVPAGYQQTFPQTVSGILWPEGVSHAAVGNVSPSLIQTSLSEGQTHTEHVSLTLPNTGALTNLVDVFLLFDDTGSFTYNSPIVRAAFPNIISELQTRLPGIDLGFGVGRLEEYGNFAAEYATGRPFILNQPIVASSAGGYTQTDVQSAIQAALDRTAPGYGGDQPETVIEALYQMVTGAGFDGNNNGSTLDSGPAGLASTQVSPGSSGDVPAFSSFVADPTQGVLQPSGTIGGAGFRSGALPIIITATDTGFAYQPKGDSTIVGIDGLSLPASSIAYHGRGTTPYSSGAGIQETVTGLNALGALVIGLGTNDSAAIDPRIGLEALASLTGAINHTTTTINNGTTNPINPGDPLYFMIGSGGDPLVGNIADGIVAAIEGAVTSVSVNVTLRASDPRVHINFTPGVINGLTAGQTAEFDVTFTGDGRPRRFDLQFIREGTDVVLGSIPVVLGTPIEGDGYEFEDCDDGEHSQNIDFGNQSITVDIPNTAPSFTGGVDVSTNEDSGVVTVAGWATNIKPGPSQEAWQTVNFIVSTNNDTLFTTLPTISADGTLSFESAADAFGTATVSVQLHDNGGTVGGGQDTSSTQFFTITVNPVNDAPVGSPDSFSLSEDGTLLGDVLANDTDVDSPVLTASVVSLPTNGNLTLLSDGTFSYQPHADYFGPDSFTYVASDGEFSTAEVLVSIVVTPVNDAPVGSPDSYS